MNYQFNVFHRRWFRDWQAYYINGRRLAMFPILKTFNPQEDYFWMAEVYDKEGKVAYFSNERVYCYGGYKTLEETRQSVISLFNKMKKEGY